MSRLQHPLAVARGLGSAKTGLEHWWWQRLTAVFLIPISLWFIVSLLIMSGMDHAAFVSWLQSPSTCVMMLIMLVAVYYHAALGLQVVIEDYVAAKWQRMACLVLIKAILLITGLISVLSVLKLYFAG